VHISEISNRFIRDASEVVKAGQIVKVKVLSVDAKNKRIALSMKALQEPAGRSPKARTEKQAPTPPATIDEKLAALSSKWKVR